MLEKMGYYVKIVPSNERALKVIKNEYFDLLIIDIPLNSELESIKTAEVIKNENPTIQLLFITGRVDLIRNGYFIINDDSMCLSKPLKGTEFKKIILNCVL